MVPPLLTINPSQLEFLFEADRELKSSLNIRNVHDDIRTAFKIKTTNTDQFIVSPPYGIVEPGTTKLVKIYFKAHSAYTDDLKFCRDCFLVQSIVVEPELTDRDITSELFRDRQKQEAKLKVLVAAPLAHGKVLEAEIKDIAKMQGVEGHRAVVRKFSELLLARGIISQAQVALAFSTVGELFQGLQGDAARLSKLGSQSFLDGKTGLLTEDSQSSQTTSSSEEWNGVPLGRMYDSSKAATFKSFPSTRDRGLAARPSSDFLAPDPFRARANGSLERPVVQASTPGTQPRDSVRPLRPALRNLASAPADMRYSVGEGPPAVDDKAEVEATPSEDESRVQRQLQYDEAVNQAFPDDMYSQQLANGLPDSTGLAEPLAANAQGKGPHFKPILEEDLGEDGLEATNAQRDPEQQPQTPQGSAQSQPEAPQASPVPSDFSPSLLPEARAEKASDTTSAQSSAGGLQAQAHDGGTDSPGPKTEAALNSAPMEMQSSGLAEEERLQDQSLENMGLSPQHDTLGRKDVMVSIDRLATPASRKQSVASPTKPSTGSNGDRKPTTTSKITSPARMYSPAPRSGDRGHVSEPPDFSELDVNVRDVDAEQRVHAPLSPTSTDVEIPSGNTMKMANFWDRREAKVQGSR